MRRGFRMRGCRAIQMDKGQGFCYHRSTIIYKLIISSGHLFGAWSSVSAQAPRLPGVSAGPWEIRLAGSEFVV